MGNSIGSTGASSQAVIADFKSSRKFKCHVKLIWLNFTVYISTDKFWLASKISTDLFYSLTKVKFGVSIWNVYLLSQGYSHLPSLFYWLFSTMLWRNSMCWNLLWGMFQELFTCASENILIISLNNVTFLELHPEILSWVEELGWH